MDTALPLDGALWGTLLLYSIGENLKTQKGLMKKVAGLGGWMGDLTAFGNFWRDRHNTKFELLRYIDGTLVIKLNSSDNNLNPAVGFVAVNTKSMHILMQDAAGNTLRYTARQYNNKLYLRRNV